MSAKRVSIDEQAARAAQLLARLGVAVLAIALPCAAVASRRTILPLAPIGAVLIIAAALLEPRRAFAPDARAAAASPTGLALLSLGAWAALSLAWTPFLSIAGERLVKTIAMGIPLAVAAVLLPTRTRTSNLYLLPIGLGAAAVATFALAWVGPASLSAYDPTGSAIERATIGCVLLLWPSLAALAVRDRWASAAVLAIAVAAAVASVFSPVIVAALALGALTFAASVAAPLTLATSLAVLGAAIVLLAPAVPFAAGLLPDAPNAGWRAALQTFDVWRQVLRVDGLPRLVTGHGLDAASRTIIAGYMPANAPRSVLFEVWYDFGLVGAVATAVLVARAFLAAARVSVNVTPFLLAGLVSGLLIAVCGQATAQLWWLTLIGIAVMEFVIALRGQYRTTRPLASAARAGPEVQA